ncbi:hypothetical protein [Neptunomonas antarctica]|uniref:Uncharacterized protein n=1 Tax=Neptunomonas antarctica TaxID=619304 RepID=A0A1N7M9A0_9GAMM|nr:hypothetical protein [Neptunomonas antarctica]SIS82632.1 hypothetical protein SAMN05421760_105282 [Neptunomonas antarctica]
MLDIIPQLLQRSDYLAVENGLIVLRPKSGDLATSDKWLKENREWVIQEILTATAKEGYIFAAYTTGYYKGAHGAGGLTLNFNNIVTGISSFISYNVSLKRERSTNSGKKGEALPNGRFNAGKSRAFLQFWSSTGLNKPKRPSGYHDCMGKLKEIVFTGEVVNGKLSKHSFKPLNISIEEIQNTCQLPDNRLTSTGQLPDNSLTRRPDKEIVQSHASQGLEPVYSTCTKKRVIKNKVIKSKEVKEMNHSVSRLENQSTDEWLEEYSNQALAENFQPDTQ